MLQIDIDIDIDIDITIYTYVCVCVKDEAKIRMAASLQLLGVTLRSVAWQKKNHPAMDGFPAMFHDTRVTLVVGYY